MPYVPPHLRNQGGQGDPSKGKSLSELADGPAGGRLQCQRPEPGGGGRGRSEHEGQGGGRPPSGWAATLCNGDGPVTASSDQSRFHPETIGSVQDARFGAAPFARLGAAPFSTPSSVSGYKYNPKGAPSRFGSAGRNRHRPLREGEDVPCGSRQDEDGMVYAMGPDALDACTYFQDRMRQYPFATDAAGLELLRRLIVVNLRVFALANARVNATDDPLETARHGEHLYVMKPTMKSSKKSEGKGTWSDSEYAHPGLQALYLRLKSFQRFTESWALFERAGALGIFDTWLQPTLSHEARWGPAPPSAQPSERRRLRVASLGGGPGYELLALAWYLQKLAAERDVLPPCLDLISLDLQPSWEPYLHALPEPDEGGSGGGDTYRFAQWDIKAGIDARDAAGGALDLCLVSNVLVYCTDDPTADVFAGLLAGGVQAILLNERGAEQKMVQMVERRGVIVTKLLDQTSAAGRDDRQLIFLPAGSPPPPPLPPGSIEHVFPNVPYEEAKTGA